MRLYRARTQGGDTSPYLTQVRIGVPSAHQIVLTQTPAQKNKAGFVVSMTPDVLACCPCRSACWEVRKRPENPHDRAKGRLAEVLHVQVNPLEEQLLGHRIRVAVVPANPAGAAWRQSEFFAVGGHRRNLLYHRTVL